MEADPNLTAQQESETECEIAHQKVVLTYEAGRKMSQNANDALSAEDLGTSSIIGQTIAGTTAPSPPRR